MTKMIDKDMQNYVGWDVRSVMKFRGVYGFRIVLKYADGSQRVQQKSGFSTKREAEKARGCREIDSPREGPV